MKEVGSRLRLLGRSAFLLPSHFPFPLPLCSFVPKLALLSLMPHSLDCTGPHPMPSSSQTSSSKTWASEGSTLSSAPSFVERSPVGSFLLRSLRNLGFSMLKVRLPSPSLSPSLPLLPLPLTHPFLEPDVCRGVGGVDQDCCCSDPLEPERRSWPVRSERC